eukprot:Hpha_TRINITY_DN14255_c0_g1::TRINITY_DN14255_c0_g1_i1::g.22122::m.22122/K15987/hppA; K(+)-stimulated pyrophosphate-energized sodium pump
MSLKGSDPPALTGHDSQRSINLTRYITLEKAQGLPNCFLKFLTDPEKEASRFGDLAEVAKLDLAPGGRFEQEFRLKVEPALDCEYSESVHKELLRLFKSLIEFRAAELHAAARGDYDTAISLQLRTRQVQSKYETILQYCCVRTLVLSAEDFSRISPFVNGKGNLPDELPEDIRAIGVFPSTSILMIDGLPFVHSLMSAPSTRNVELRVRIPVQASLEDWGCAPAKGAVLPPDSSHICRRILSGTLFLLGLALFVGAAVVPTDWEDIYDPPESGLVGRFFTAYHAPFTIPGCINATIAAVEQDDPTGEIAWAQETLADCSFGIPIRAIMVAGGAGLWGIAVSTWWSASVLARSRGSADMSDASVRVFQATRAYLRPAGIATAVMAGLGAVLALGVADRIGRKPWRPDVCVSVLIGAGLSWLAGYLAVQSAVEASSRVAAVVWMQGNLNGMSHGVRVTFQNGASSGLVAVAFSIAGSAFCYGATANAQSVVGFALGTCLTCVAGRTAAGICSAGLRQAVRRCTKHKVGARQTTGHSAVIDAVVATSIFLIDILGGVSDTAETAACVLAAGVVLGTLEFGTHGANFALLAAAVGIFASILTVSWMWIPDKRREDEPMSSRMARALSCNVLLGRLVVFFGLFVLVFVVLKDPASDLVDAAGSQREPAWRLCACVTLGILLGVLAGRVTKRFTNVDHAPAQTVARASTSGVSVELLRGLGCALHGSYVNLIVLGLVVILAHELAGWFGVAMAARGAVTLSPVVHAAMTCVPVGLAAEFCSMLCPVVPKWVRPVLRDIEDIGYKYATAEKGLKHVSASIVSLSLVAAFGAEANVFSADLVSPQVMAGVFFGVLFPYGLGALMSVAIAAAANRTEKEIRAQVQEVSLQQGHSMQQGHSSGSEEGAFIDDAEALDKACARILKVGAWSSLGWLIPILSAAVALPVGIGLFLGSTFLYSALVAGVLSNAAFGMQYGTAGRMWNSVFRWLDKGGYQSAMPKRDEEGRLHLFRGIVLDEKVTHGPGSTGHTSASECDWVGAPLRDAVVPGLSSMIKLTACWALVVGRNMDERWDKYWVGLIVVGILCVTLVAMHFLKKLCCSSKEDVRGSYETEPQYIPEVEDQHHDVEDQEMDEVPEPAGEPQEDK